MALVFVRFALDNIYYFKESNDGVTSPYWNPLICEIYQSDFGFLYCYKSLISNSLFEIKKVDLSLEKNDACDLHKLEKYLNDINFVCQDLLLREFADLGNSEHTVVFCFDSGIYLTIVPFLSQLCFPIIARCHYIFDFNLKYLRNCFAIKESKPLDRQEVILEHCRINFSDDSNLKVYFFFKGLMSYNNKQVPINSSSILVPQNAEENIDNESDLYNLEGLILLDWKNLPIEYFYNNNSLQKGEVIRLDSVYINYFNQKYRTESKLELYSYLDKSLSKKTTHLYFDTMSESQTLPIWVRSREEEEFIIYLCPLGKYFKTTHLELDFHISADVGIQMQLYSPDELVSKSFVINFYDSEWFGKQSDNNNKSFFHN